MSVLLLLQPLTPLGGDVHELVTLTFSALPRLIGESHVLVVKNFFDARDAIVNIT